MSQIAPSKDIRSVTDLKRSTREILDHLHASGRPVILTVNGKADAVLLDVRAYERLLRAGNLAGLLAPAERELNAGKTRPLRKLMEDLKRDKGISG